MSVPGKIGIYRIASALGENSRVKTFLAFRGTETTPKLLKLYTLDSMEQEDITDTLFEIQVLASIRHPYILNYYEAFLEEEQRALVVVTECCEEGSLQSLLQRVYQRDTSAIDLLGEKIKQMFCQIVLALREVNRYNLVHRNINPKDIFIDDSGTVKIGGFERCKLQTVAPTQISYSEYPGYSAPETFELDKYTIRSDIWSMGIVFYELLYFEVPFQSPDLQTLIGFIKNSKLEPPKDSKLGGELEDLVAIIPKLLRKHPLQRLTVDNLLALKSLNAVFKEIYNLHPELASSERRLGQPERLLPGVEIKTPGQIPSNFNKQLRQLRKLRVINVLEGRDDLEDAGKLKEPHAAPRNLSKPKKGGRQPKKPSRSPEREPAKLVPAEDLVKGNLKPKSNAAQSGKKSFDPARLPRESFLDDSHRDEDHDDECSVCHHRKGTLPIVNRDVLVPNHLNKLKKMWNNQFLEEILILKGSDYEYIDRVRPMMNLKVKLGIAPPNGKDVLMDKLKVFTPAKSVDKRPQVSQDKSGVDRNIFTKSVDSRRGNLDRVPTQESGRNLMVPDVRDVPTRGMPAGPRKVDTSYQPPDYVDEIKEFAEGKHMNLRDFKRAKKSAQEPSDTSRAQKPRQLLRDSKANPGSSVLPPLNK